MVWVGSVREEDEREEVADPDVFTRTPDAGFRDTTLATFHHRVPALEARGTVTGLAGLYTINRQDVHPVVGPSGVDGFWLANGFSGHGFKLAPMIGSMVASALGADRDDFATDVPIEMFAIDRNPIGVDAKNVLA
jgi:sarcosine oxidase subunit beta